MKFEHGQLSESLISEVLPLLEAHWLEIPVDPDLPLEPDWIKYLHMQEQGSFKAFLARDDEGKLVGYNAFFIHYNLHSSSSLQASQDVIYIDKERRGFGRSFIDWCDGQLATMGVQKVYAHVNAKHNFGRMLESIGYEKVDLIYARRLDEASA